MDSSNSCPETLVPSASNRSTPEWTPVDSAKGEFDEKHLRAGVMRGGAGRVAGIAKNAGGPALKPCQHVWQMLAVVAGKRG